MSPILDGDFSEIFDDFKSAGRQDFFDQIFADKCPCGTGGLLKTWPPDTRDGIKFCGPCRMKKALAL